jgi:hypothetical protein
MMVGMMAGFGFTTAFYMKGFFSFETSREYTFRSIDALRYSFYSRKTYIFQDLFHIFSRGNIFCFSSYVLRVIILKSNKLISLGFQFLFVRNYNHISLSLIRTEIIYVAVLTDACFALELFI